MLLPSSSNKLAISLACSISLAITKPPAFEWLINNAAKYHFVMSFPKGNVQGVSYEPWHWRFEGTVEALKKFKKANKLLSSEQIKN